MLVVALWYLNYDPFVSRCRYYSSDQDTLFKEAHVISPYRRQTSHPRMRVNVFQSNALHYLVPFVQFKKRKKHPWRSLILVILQASLQLC